MYILRYVGVDESEDVQLFYYFAKSDLNPREDPLVLWLTGGPGCSSFTGFAYEVGKWTFYLFLYIYIYILNESTDPIMNTGEQDDDELKIALRSVAASLAIHTGLMAESCTMKSSLKWLLFDRVMETWKLDVNPLNFMCSCLLLPGFSCISSHWLRCRNLESGQDSRLIRWP